MPAGSPVTAAVRAAERGERAAKRLVGYSGTLLKRERINGTLLESEMKLVLQESPKKVYLKFIAPHEGRQVLYREGQNNGNMLVKQTGLAALLGTMSVDPHGSLALKESRHPITEAGLQNLATKVADGWQQAARATGASAAVVRRYPNAKFAGTDCEAFEVTHPQPGPGAAIYRTRLFLDQKTDLPVRVQRFDFPVASGKPAVVEDYAYLDLDLTPPAAIDLDPANPAYGF